MSTPDVVNINEISSTEKDHNSQSNVDPQKQNRLHSSVSLATLTCIICLEICKDPYQTTCCSSLTCKKCKDSLTKGMDLVSCPNCRKSEILFVESKVAKRVIDLVITICPIDGCDKTMERQLIVKHLNKKHSDIDANKLEKIIQKIEPKIQEKILNYKISSKIHRHFLTKKSGFDGFCNSKIFLRTVGNCKKVIDASDNFYSCEGCNLWFCLSCIDKPSEFSHSVTHKHPLELTFLNRGWSCNGSGESNGCRSPNHINFESEKKMRYRCSECDYDLCGNCMEYYNKF